MANATAKSAEVRNQELDDYLQQVVQDGRKGLTTLERRLKGTYWVIIVLSLVMFAVGIVLLGVPAFAAFGNKIDFLQTVVTAGFGVADLTGLFLLKPIDKIHKMMGDMSQVTVALSAFNIETALRLREMDGANRESVGAAAQHIKQAGKDCVTLVQNYFEEKPVENPPAK